MIPNNESYYNAVQNIKDQWQRITDMLILNPNDGDTKTLAKFSSDLSKLQTSASIITYLCEKKVCRRARTIRVQPTSIARRKNRGLPNPENLKRKRVHNISININNNEPPAKKH